VKRAWLLWLGLAAIVVNSGVSRSGADFVSSSASPGNAFAAAADFNTVAVSITDPGTPLSGTIGLQATASSERGIERVRFQSSPAGAGIWTDACEDASAPYACNWDTAGVADGSRDVRAVAVDQAGYQRVSTVGARLIDNTAPTSTLANPTNTLSGNVALSGTAADAGSGVAAWIAQYSAAGANSWTDACSDTVTPFTTCTWATTGVMDGRYDLRALVLDVAGNQTASTVRTNKVIDNDTTPTGTDIQTANGGATAGRAEQNDTITLTYSEPINPTTVDASFTGASMAIRVSLTNRGGGDRMDFETTGGTRLNLVDNANGLNLGDTNYVSNTVTFNATMIQTANTIVITLGTVNSGSGNLRTATSNSTMSWTPSASATDWASNSVGTAALTEAAPADLEF
jgi:hypothetical protein